MPRTCILMAMLMCLWAFPTMTCGAAPSGGDLPPVFDTRPYADAKKAAEDGKKWFIVKATAVWCAPCKRMDATTWRDEKIVKWLEANAIVVAVDVDKEKKIAESLSIEAMPTMVAFKDGKEFDRVVGYKSPEDFIVWLEGIQKGEKLIELVKKRAGTKGAAGEKVDIRARMDLARTLAQSGKYEEAADEYLWLWQHALEHERAYYGVRLSFMVGDMERLASNSAAAKRKFQEVRDKTGTALDKEKVDIETVVDWVALNRVVRDNQATLAWYDKVKTQPRAKPLITRVSRELSELFMSENRWADLGNLYANPLRQLQDDLDMEQMMAKHDLGDQIDKTTRKHLDDMQRKESSDKIGRVYAGLLAAGRDKEAAEYGAKAMELYPKQGITTAIVTWALKAEQPRQSQIDWLAKADPDDANTASLRTRVEQALKNKKDK